MIAAGSAVTLFDKWRSGRADPVHVGLSPRVGWYLALQIGSTPTIVRRWRAKRLKALAFGREPPSVVLESIEGAIERLHLQLFRCNSCVAAVPAEDVEGLQQEQAGDGGQENFEHAFMTPWPAI